MLKKSKNTAATMDKSIHDSALKPSPIKGKELNNELKFSSSKILKKLSMSFYAEDTLKMNKQIILDDCDNDSDYDNFCEKGSLVIKRN